MAPRTRQPVTLSRRRLLAVVGVAPVLAAVLAACGDDSSTDGAGSGTEPPAPAPGAIEHPTDPMAVVLRIGSGVGGFTTPEYAFAQLPELVIGGDGRLVRPGPQIEIYPQPILPALQSTELSEAEVQALLALADDAGLLADPPDYDATDPGVTDVGSTIVTLGAKGGTFVHSAYALGMETEPDEARQRLSAFVAAAQELVGRLTGDEVFVPEQFAIGWMDVDATEYADSDIEPTVVPWPDSFGSPEGECLMVDGTVVTEALSAANQLTFFSVASDGGEARTVRLLLRPVLPGSQTC